MTQNSSSSLENDIDKSLEDMLAFLPKEEIATIMGQANDQDQIANDVAKSKQAVLPLPENLQMMNNGHFLDSSVPASQKKPFQQITVAPHLMEQAKAEKEKQDEKEKEEYRGKSRYMVNPNGKMLECKECGAFLKTKASLEVHVKSRHLRLKDFKCIFCEYSSAQKGAIGGHMRATHNKTEKFECIACMKLLDGKREASQHAKEHKNPSLPSGFENQFTPRIATFIEP